MSQYVIAATDDSYYEPYKPVNNRDLKTGKEILDPEELKQKRGPFFSCDGAIHDPHFHAVDRHPIMDSEINNKKLNIEQLHVPGFDEHDGHDLSPSSLPFNVATGWHITIPSEKEGGDHHFYQFSHTQKFPESVDNDEALDSWKEHMGKMFGGGIFEEEPLKIGDNNGNFAPTYTFHPSENANNPSSTDCTFFPRVEHAGILSPAIARTNLGDDTTSAEEAKSKIIDYANITKEHAHQNMENKLSEDANIWEDRFKQSKRIYTLGSNGRILDVQDYAPGLIRHGKKCDCDVCSHWSGMDFRIG